MQINQDTFQNDKLYYGMKNGRQRLQLMWFRADKFKDLFIDDYPDIFLKLQGEHRRVVKFLNDYKIHSHFKYISQLSSGITDSTMEAVCTDEFEVLIKRFRNHLHHKSKQTNDELYFSLDLAFKPQ